MQASHPVAGLVGRLVKQQYAACGDGTKTAILLVAELVKQCHVLQTMHKLHPLQIAQVLGTSTSRQVLDLIKLNSISLLPNATATSLLEPNVQLVEQAAYTAIRCHVHDDVLAKVSRDGIYVIG